MKEQTWFLSLFTTNIECYLNAQIFRLTFLDKIELNELNGKDLPSQFSSLPPYEVRSKLMKLPSLNDFDMDQNLVNAKNSKYYEMSELRYVYNSKFFQFVSFQP